MLKRINEILGFKVIAPDGEVGTVDDFYFDDQEWTVRYLVIDSVSPFSDRKVLIPVSEIDRYDFDDQCLTLTSSMVQFENHLDLHSILPVSRQNESELLRYYECSVNHNGNGSHTGLTSDLLTERGPAIQTAEWDPHLRSFTEVKRYQCQTVDGLVIGDIEDCMIEMDVWFICFAVIDACNLINREKVLLPSAWIRLVNMVFKQIRFDLTIEEVSNSPVYDLTVPIDFSFKIMLLDHYGYGSSKIS
jgi:sporulation protein YlmC with PRC-barrel domain